MTPAEILAAVEKYGEPEIVALITGLCGCSWAAAPIEALTKLAESVAKAVAAKNELAAMKAAVAGADAAADAAEQLAVKS